MILCDSNILVYAYDSLSPFHAKAKNFLEEKTKRKGEICFTTQIFLEFFAVITKKVKNPLKIKIALGLIKEIKENENVVFISPLETSGFRAFELAQKYKIAGQNIFDAYLVATMIDNDVKKIATHNLKDFQNFSGITALNPL